MAVRSPAACRCYPLWPGSSDIGFFHIKPMNRSILVACIMFLVLSLGCSRQQLDSRINTGGIYRSVASEVSRDGKESWKYLRFYDDSIVIFTSSRGEPSDLKKWFTKEHARVRQGSVSAIGDSISFTLSGVEGRTDYSGKIDGNRLHLLLSNKIPGYEGKSKQSFVFVGWSDDIELLAID